MTDFSTFACATHTGKIREHNEDSYLFMPEQGLWVVADGMGGHECGEVASAIVILQIASRIKSGEDLESALRYAHREVLSAAENGIGKRGMGSTVVALEVKGNDYQIAWIGDSRAYLWDGKSLKQLTHDHSVIQELLDSGGVSELDAKQHPFRNILTRSLGGVNNEAINADVVDGSFHQGNKILLCSDGLTSELSDAEIAEILLDFEDEQSAVNRMINTALYHGGSDNITVLLISAHGLMRLGNTF